MALGTASALLLAGGAFSATTQLMGAGQQAKSIQRQANYNAEIYEQQAGMITEKKRIQDYQFLRDSNRARGSIVAATAGKGLKMGGSPLAILIDNETQMQFDKAIADYNLDVERNYAKSGAINTRQQGAIDARNTRMAGYTNAFSTILNTGAQVGLMNMKSPMAPKGRTINRSSTTASRPYNSPYGNRYI